MPEPAKEKEKGGAERRRSARIELHIPIRVQGTSSNGQPVNENAEAEQVSSQGARIKAKTEFRLGTAMKVENLQTRQSAEFRVVWVVLKDQGKWQLGLEMTKGQTPIWGVDLSPPPAPHH